MISTSPSRHRLPVNRRDRAASVRFALKNVGSLLFSVALVGSVVWAALVCPAEAVGYKPNQVAYAHTYLHCERGGRERLTLERHLGRDEWSVMSYQLSAISFQQEQTRAERSGDL